MNGRPVAFSSHTGGLHGRDVSRDIKPNAIGFALLWPAKAELVKELHRIINEAIRTHDQAQGLTFDLSQIDLERLRDEFTKKVARKATALQDIREIVEQKLAEMLARNPMRMDYPRKYEDIVADYNSEKDRTTIEETFRRLVELVQSLDEEQARAARENLSDE